MVLSRLSQILKPNSIKFSFGLFLRFEWAVTCWLGVFLSFFVLRPLWDGGPHDVYYHIPAGCCHRARRLETQNMGLQLVLFVSNFNLHLWLFWHFYSLDQIITAQIKAHYLPFSKQSFASLAWDSSTATVLYAGARSVS